MGPKLIVHSSVEGRGGVVAVGSCELGDAFEGVESSEMGEE